MLCAYCLSCYVFHMIKRKVGDLFPKTVLTGLHNGDTVLPVR